MKKIYTDKTMSLNRLLMVGCLLFALLGTTRLAWSLVETSSEWDKVESMISTATAIAYGATATVETVALKYADEKATSLSNYGTARAEIFATAAIPTFTPTPVFVSSPLTIMMVTPTKTVVQRLQETADQLEDLEQSRSDFRAMQVTNWLEALSNVLTVVVAIAGYVYVIRRG